MLTVIQCGTLLSSLFKSKAPLEYHHIRVIALNANDIDWLLFGLRHFPLPRNGVDWNALKVKVNPVGWVV